MNRLLLISLCLLSPVLAGAAPSADEAYQGAKTEYQKLKKDEKRRTFRHHWLNVAKRFDVVAVKFPKSERAPEALFMSGQLFSDLSRLSQNQEDLTSAERSWRKLIDGWPKHRLSDDAALGLARLLAERRNDPKGARKVLEQTVGSANDMKADLQKLLASLPAPPPPAPKKKDVVTSKPVVTSHPAKLEEVAEPSEPQRRVSALAEALRKLQEAPVNPEHAAEEPEPEPTVQGRRTPVALRPEAPELEATVDADAVEPEPTAIASLQERLRDVRVGERPRDPEPAAKMKLAALAKHQQGAEVSLAQQLGLKVRRVIIDAGHGGHDTGAIGPTGVREKDVALSVVLKLKDRLEAQGLEVVLTRDDDTFIALEERTRRANREHGDLFISIHCNAAPSKSLRGIETYTLNTSSNRYAVRLAARENATTERGINDLQYILADLATKANTGESQRLADRVQRTLIRGLAKDYKGVRDLGTKEALFVVLLGAKMPSILVETSFLSNPEDEQRLASDEYQSSLADHIAEAVDGFLEERTKVAQVD